MRDQVLGCGYMVIGAVMCGEVLQHFIGWANLVWLILMLFGIFLFSSGLNWIRTH